MKTRAAVLETIGLAAPYAASQPLKIREVELDAPGEGELLIRIRAAGLCHSDLSVVNVDRNRPVPMALGHEACATVVAVGDGARFAAGDRVVLAFLPACGHCTHCVSGTPWLCAEAAAANGRGELIGGGRRLCENGHAVHHHLGVSAFATHAVIDQRSAVRIDADIPPNIAALFGCAVVTGAGAVINTAQVKAGSSVAIVGLGGVGLMSLLAARMSGCRQIIAIDLLEDKLSLARQLGATDTVNAGSPDAVEQARALSGGGVDYAFELASSVKALELAYKVTRRGGTTVTASLPHPTHTAAIPVTQLVAEERTLKGSYIGSCVPARDIPRFIALYQQGLLPVDRLLSERISLDDINRGFDRLADGASVRQILLP